MCYQFLRVSTFCSAISWFWVTGHFEKVHWITPNRSWTLQCQSTYICITTVSESQISLWFALWPAIFEIYVISRQVHQITSNWPWSLQGHMYPIYPKVICTPYTCYYYQCSLRFALQPAIFELQAILKQVHWMTSKWPWTLQGQRYTTYVLLVSPSPKFWSVSLYDQPFSRHRSFWGKRDLECCKVICTPYMGY